MDFQFIRKTDIKNFLDTLSVDNNIFYLADSLFYKNFTKNGSFDDINIDKVRSISPVRMFLYIHNERMMLNEANQDKLNILFGLKSCDLNAIKILDEVFLKGVCEDPFYKRMKDNTIIFSSDCPEPQSMCFCSYVGEGKPYPGQEQNQKYDLNFSGIGDGYIVETGSEKGESILSQALAFFKEATQEQLSERKKMREDSMERLDVINKDFSKIKNMDFHALTKTKFNSDGWKEFSKTCVQCTGCNNICPSCYCFYLSEQNNLKKATEFKFEKLRFFDACHYTSHGRVAGGANSRPKLFERFRNRYQCKLNYRKENFDLYGCTGCGRCISVCPGKIDIRKVVAELARP